MEVAASTAPSPDLAATKCSGYNLEESWSRMLGSLPLADSGWLWQTLAGSGRPWLALADPLLPQGGPGLTHGIAASRDRTPRTPPRRIPEAGPVAANSVKHREVCV